MNAYDDDFQYLVEYAEDDWMPISTVSAIAAGHSGADADSRRKTDRLVEIIGELIDHGALPGELSEGKPRFKPWPGTKDELLSRFRMEVEALGRLPDIDEVCWIHIPPGKRRFPDAESTTVDYAAELQELARGASIQRVSMAAVSALSGRVLGPDASFAEHVPVMVRIIGDLIDRGAVLTERVGTDTSASFQRWPGTKQDWLDRFRTELEALGRLPDLYEIGWIRIPAQDRTEG